jgi:DNA-binding CsgD family transcriptional regulator
VEIGQLLGLSPKTVGHHLSSILGKCGVRSRVDIAALVIRGTLPIHRAM